MRAGGSHADPDAYRQRRGRDRIDGLDAGDDYLVKPFDVGELGARVRALLRRTRAELDGEHLSFGAWSSTPTYTAPGSATRWSS